MNDLNAHAQRNITPTGHNGDDNRNWNWHLLIPIAGLALYQWHTRQSMRKEFDCWRRSIERERREDKAMAVIHEIRRLLYARQEIICSNSLPYFAQGTREEELINMATSEPIALELNIRADLTKIFQHSTPCSRAMINKYVEDWQSSVKSTLNNKD